MYDFENRLVEVKRLPTMQSSAYVTVAKYTYDALGRRIRQQHFDTQALPIVGMDWTFYYDGQNVVAQYRYDPAAGETLDRYFIHGLHHTSASGVWCIDERAVMHDVTQDAEYYYVLGQNWSVEALVNTRGREVEHYSYDAYGQPVITAVHSWDVDFDGDIDFFDKSALLFADGLNPCQVQTWLDIDGDGDIDTADRSGIGQNFGPSLVAIPLSGIGNPYAFTGRWMDHFDFVNFVPRKMVYHQRGRTYDQLHGRFLQRDPLARAQVVLAMLPNRGTSAWFLKRMPLVLRDTAWEINNARVTQQLRFPHLNQQVVDAYLEFVDGANLYEYVKSGPANSVDPFGFACKGGKRGDKCYSVEMRIMPGRDLSPKEELDAVIIAGAAEAYVCTTTARPIDKKVPIPGGVAPSPSPTPGDSLIGMGQLFSNLTKGGVTSIWTRHECRECRCVQGCSWFGRIFYTPKDGWAQDSQSEWKKCNQSLDALPAMDPGVTMKGFGPEAT
ncbi:MAG: hypothetical protein ACE5GE_11475, partial [Phycisphaerae bacterium]